MKRGRDYQRRRRGMEKKRYMAVPTTIKNPLPVAKANMTPKRTQAICMLVVSQAQEETDRNASDGSDQASEEPFANETVHIHRDLRGPGISLMFSMRNCSCRGPVHRTNAQYVPYGVSMRMVCVVEGTPAGRSM